MTTALTTALPVTSAHQARELELRRLLETTAHFAAQWHGADFLLIDRTGNPATAGVLAHLADGRLVDLWDLNPVLWDDAHWAALRAVAVGDSRIVRPHLHRD
jgi:hypothetical protein